ncbi:Bpu10I family restriction endonuclease [Escherichia coli]|uniref:Bpu10I family restriction endonuclease n=1 Tax=Escherichia coli TaxID=562 RepID=UPI00025112F1|nr:Bpu10I family restriction endonuclease [Escherichia coli]EHX31127.1 bpu10I restriction endonuclease family protein [Escherichia coli DEC12C]EFE0740087.1 Bpu10I family restriction endonuclease [Escherichia coli]EHW89117.1 bpu10I restriction endonuclease family protein [Escherichia coli DEC10E]ELM0467594.1 Bpu10I family restriction endonuclease [Escherichia coli]OKU92592.1 restriction endonuclease [Escherichia coli]
MVNVVQIRAHGDKLHALARNTKLPASDRPRVEAQIQAYDSWVASMDALQSEGDELLAELVDLLNEYKKSVEFDLIFCSEENFLYRQKGQLKLDNTILEEFLPRLFDARLIPGFARQNGLECGPRASFAGLSFESPLLSLSNGGVYIKRKDQDFSVTRQHKLRITTPSNPDDAFEQDFHVSYFATEIKTNLDKTMFQEAAATAGELKRVSSGSKYVLLCEWLDMTPINTKLTAMDEVIVLRRAKRLGSNQRSAFSTAEGRQEKREWYSDFLDSHPLSLEGFKRLIWHLNECFPAVEHDSEDIVLERGYF